MNAWYELPNDKRIDAVRAHCKAHPDKWDAAWDTGRTICTLTMRDDARVAAQYTARELGRTDVFYVAKYNLGDRRYELSDAGQALVAWDEAGDMLDMSVDEVQALAMVGIHAAVLLLPAVIAMNERNQYVNDR